MLSTWNQGQGSDWSVRGGIDTGPLVGDVQCSMAGDAGGAVCPARERDSCGLWDALWLYVKEIKLSKLKRIKTSNTTFIYHSPIPPQKLIKKWYIPLKYR